MTKKKLTNRQRKELLNALEGVAEDLFDQLNGTTAVEIDDKVVNKDLIVFFTLAVLAKNPIIQEDIDKIYYQSPIEYYTNYEKSTIYAKNKMDVLLMDSADTFIKLIGIFEDCERKLQHPTIYNLAKKAYRKQYNILKNAGNTITVDNFKILTKDITTYIELLPVLLLFLNKERIALKGDEQEIKLLLNKTLIITNSKLGKGGATGRVKPSIQENLQLFQKTNKGVLKEIKKFFVDYELMNVTLSEFVLILQASNRDGLSYEEKIIVDILLETVKRELEYLEVHNLLSLANIVKVTDALYTEAISIVGYTQVQRGDEDSSINTLNQLLPELVRQIIMIMFRNEYASARDKVLNNQDLKSIAELKIKTQEELQQLQYEQENLQQVIEGYKQQASEAYNTLQDMTSLYENASQDVKNLTRTQKELEKQLAKVQKDLALAQQKQQSTEESSISHEEMRQAIQDEPIIILGGHDKFQQKMSEVLNVIKVYHVDDLNRDFSSLQHYDGIAIYHTGYNSHMFSSKVTQNIGNNMDIIYLNQTVNIEKIVQEVYDCQQRRKIQQS